LVVRGGELDPLVLRADALRYHNVYASFVNRNCQFRHEAPELHQSVLPGTSAAAARARHMALP